MTTAKTGSSTSAVNATASSSKRLSGLISGLDTDTLVQQLTSGTQSKIDKQMQNKQIATWRQQSYREVISALSEFKSKYFSSATSSSSILSAGFFNSTSIKNTSPYLNVTGSSTTAANMMVTKISNLARQASLYSSHQVSNGTLTTGAIQDSWAQNLLSGSSVIISYGGKDYSVALDGDFALNSSSSVPPTQDYLKQITETLNNKISQMDGLSGNVSFGINGSGNVTLSKSGSATGQFTIKDGSDNLLKGLGLSSQKGVAADSVEGTPANSDYFFKNAVAAGSSLEFKVGDNTYSLKISGGISLPIGGTAAQTATVLQSELKRAIAVDSNLKDKLDVSVDETGNVAFTTKNSETLAVTGGSENLLNGLGLAQGGGVYGTSGAINLQDLTKTYLSDSLSGSTLTFNLNGLSKSITFNESDKEQYSTAEGVKDYLNAKLKTAFGEVTDSSNNAFSKVSVTTDASGALSFKVAGKDSSGNITYTGTDTLTLTSSDKSGVLGITGALRTYAGESNRINTKKTLEDLSSVPPVGYPDMAIKPTNLATPLSGDTSYEINVNGKSFTFKNTDSVDTIMKTINNDNDANVMISYSSTTNTFSAVAKNGGATSRVDISDVKGNLAQALFGDSGSYQVIGGQDAVMSITFDGNPSHATTITRSDNNFELDGVNFQLLQKTDDSTVNDTTPIKFSVENKTDDLYNKIKDFVTDYNNIIKLVSGKVSEKKPTDGTYAPLTDSQKKDMSETQITNWETQAKKGILQGDSILDTLGLNLRRSMTDQVSSIGSALYQFGIASKDYSDNGALTIDEDKLKAALTNDPDKIAALFTESDGIAGKLQGVIQSNINTSVVDTGILVQKAGSDSSSSTIDTSTLAQNIRDYDSQIKTLKTRLESEQERYYSKFTQLEQYLSQMNSQASWFTQNSSSSTGS